MEVKKEEIRRWINDVYAKLQDLFSLYEETDGFHTTPEGETEENLQDFINRKMGEIRRCAENFSLYMDEKEIAEVTKSKPKLAMLVPGLIFAAPEVEQAVDKLRQIINDTESFFGRHINQYGVMSVVFFWSALNPHLTYFDRVFDLMEQYPETYREMGVQGERFVHIDAQTCSPEDKIYFPREFPGSELVAERNAYFEEIKERNQRENLHWSKERFYQEELLYTLKLLFERDFKEYL